MIEQLTNAVPRLRHVPAHADEPEPWDEFVKYCDPELGGVYRGVATFTLTPGLPVTEDSIR